MQYVASVAQQLLKRCGLPTTTSDIAVVTQFVKSAAEMATGNRAGDLAATAQRRIGEVAASTAGSALGQRLNCADPAVAQFGAGLPRTLRANERGPSDGPSTFIAGCSQSLTVDQCTCLAKQAQAVHPSIHDTVYGREVIPYLVRSNPLVGIQIAVLCGITRY